MEKTIEEQAFTALDLAQKTGRAQQVGLAMVIYEDSQWLLYQYLPSGAFFECDFFFKDETKKAFEAFVKIAESPKPIHKKRGYK